MRISSSLVLVAACALRAGAQASADAASSPTDALARWVALTAPTGAEELATNALLRVLPGWSRDANGNLVRHVGHGTPRRVIACALDVSGYVVSEITDDGYLRLHRTGAAPANPLADQFMEAHKVRIYTAHAMVPGVVAIANGHFARQHRADTTVVTADQLWVDVGASSRADVDRLGISLLDPVVADRPLWTYDGFVAGPGAAARVGCAAVATAAQATIPDGETVFIISAQHAMNWAGLTAALSRVGPHDELIYVGEARRGPGAQQAKAIVPHARFAGSLVESIATTDAVDLLSKVLAAAGTASSAEVRWVVPPAPVEPPRAPRTDALGDAEHQVMALLDIPAVPGHEWRVRDAVRDALPAWARQRAVVDSAGNLIVGAGPDRDSVAFVAHTDEVSFEVDRILPDGSVTLVRKGGPVVSAWEGQLAELHFDRDAGGHVAESLRGVFPPRDSARVKSPPRLTAWFGYDSAGLVAHGVRPGSAITGEKKAIRLAGTRLAGRASDDRTGDAALLLAIHRIDPAALHHKVLFVWTTGEEGGLLGAGFFGAHSGAGLKRVYAVDTFVSSDTPLEARTFAYAPLGKGAVLRGLDNATVVPRAERDRVIDVARAKGIPLQLGTTEGSTDGSAVGRSGPPNIGISWPGRYSHAPGEVLDLRDLDALSRLVTALAIAP